ncbi:MAG: hypothetical protein A3K90_03720 [Pelodictyon luteolum]|uniref:Imidazoleglycerol-phosphate dehydratase n=1 Tax=Pelodictyon luteolum TaxID=1100 RepID=A0A165LSI9_PELLU|nr:MAG: hypothetical protein A3K90_03720 [Pelodictyon luteolum]
MAAGRHTQIALLEGHESHDGHDGHDGHNTHHMIEAMFKAFALAMKDAVRIQGGGIPSTKGEL